MQAHTRNIVGPEGTCPPANGFEMSLIGWECFPGAQPWACASPWSAPSTPVMVIENGIATADDSRRID